MEVKAKLRHLRIAPRKVRLVADALRGERVAKAKSFLGFTVKKSTDPMLKLLNSAIANAKNDYGIDESNLYISEIRVDEGPKLKRWMPRARGSASQIQKKTSHITIILDEIKKTAKPAKKKTEPKTEKTVVSKVKEIKDTEIEKKTKSKWNKKESVTKTSTDKTANKKMFRRKSI